CAPVGPRPDRCHLDRRPRYRPDCPQGRPAADAAHARPDASAHAAGPGNATVTVFRSGVALAALLLVGLPLTLPVVHALAAPAAWRGWLEGERLLALLTTTVTLAAWVCLLTLPAGAVLGFVLFRSDLPGRRFFRALLLLSLFVPLPLVATAWQALLNRGGW